MTVGRSDAVALETQIDRWVRWVGRVTRPKALARSVEPGSAGSISRFGRASASPKRSGYDPLGGLNRHDLGGGDRRAQSGTKSVKLHRRNPTTRCRILKRIEGEDPMPQSDRSEQIDRGVLEHLAIAHRLRRREWVRAMDVGRGPHVHPTLTRLIKRGFVERRPRSGTSPNLAPDDQSSRRHEYKISDAGLSYLRRLEGE
jgi:hypothetical protein